MCSCIKGGVVAGIVLFVWGFVSWMALPWHKDTLNAFKDEKAVAEVIKVNAVHSGMYFMPMQGMEMAEQKSSLPMVFSSVHLEGVSPSMTKQIITGLIGQILAATLVGWLLLQVSGLNYFQRVGFVVVFAVAASIISYLPNWNWFAFDTNFSLVLVADTLISWFLAGLVLAWICKKKN